MEAAAGIELIVCITEGIPVAQIVEVKSLSNRPVRTLSDRIVGVLTPGAAKVGIIPSFIAKGRVELFLNRR